MRPSMCRTEERIAKVQGVIHRTRSRLGYPYVGAAANGYTIVRLTHTGCPGPRLPGILVAGKMGAAALGGPGFPFAFTDLFAS